MVPRAKRGSVLGCVLSPHTKLHMYVLKIKHCFQCAASAYYAFYATNVRQALMLQMAVCC